MIKRIKNIDWMNVLFYAVATLIICGVCYGAYLSVVYTPNTGPILTYASRCLKAGGQIVQGKNNVTVCVRDILAEGR